MRWLKRRNERQRGHAMTEMALTLPLVLLMVMGIMDFGRMLFIYSQVSNAAREGVRWGSVTGVVPQGTAPHFVDCNGIREAVLTRFANILDITEDDISIQYDDGATLKGFNCNGSNPSQTLIEQGDRILVTEPPIG
jgi:Flp pilus assembly protein TadG